ncbi:hypothetical protein P9B04_04850, partial [Crocosphaera sp. Alani8]
MLLKVSLDNSLQIGRKLHEELSLLTSENEITLFNQDCGGEKVVQSYLKLLQWWNSLSKDWQRKIVNTPFKLVQENLWFQLSQLSFEDLKQWYQGIIQRSEKSSENNGSRTLPPKIWKKVASEIRPQKQVKRS